MTPRRLPRRNPERGTVVVLVALVSTTLLAFTALAVDVGYLYQCRRSLQSATDAATMAGLTVLAGDQSSTGQSNAATMARTFATANGYTNGVAGATVTATPTASQLRVTITSAKTTFFAGVLWPPHKNADRHGCGTTGPGGTRGLCGRHDLPSNVDRTAVERNGVLDHG